MSLTRLIASTDPLTQGVKEALLMAVVDKLPSGHKLKKRMFVHFTSNIRKSERDYVQ